GYRHFCRPHDASRVPPRGTRDHHRDGHARAGHRRSCRAGHLLRGRPDPEGWSAAGGAGVSFLDTLLVALQAVGRNKLRSFLTALGIIIGVASVVTMVQLGQSATRQVTEQIASIGSNLLFVSPGTNRRGPGGLRTSAEPFDI